jgi:hypothetical protein
VTRKFHCLIGTVLLFCVPADGHACSCLARPDVAQAFETADAMFEGTVLGITRAERWAPRRRFFEWFYNATALQYPPWLEKELRDYWDGPHYGLAIRFRVTGYWKGGNAPELVVRTGFAGGDCGYPFKVGESYRVYARRPTTDISTPGSSADLNYLSTGMCTRTMESFSARVEVLPPARFQWVAH